MRNGRRNSTTDLRSQAFLLVCACCRWPPSAAVDEAVRVASARVADWDAFLQLVRRYRVAGLVHRALVSASVDLPTGMLSDVTSSAQRIARRHMKHAAETVRLQRLLDESGIPNLTLKGPALAQLAYGSPSLKHGRDIDILIGPDRAAAAFQVLEREGYVVSSGIKGLDETRRSALIRYGEELQFVDRRRELCVELHWRLASNPLLLKDIDVHSPTQDIALFDGAVVRTLNDDDLFSYLCVHGAHHHWSRLKWLADLNAFLARKDSDVVMRLYRHAQAKGAGLCAGQALLLCRQLLDLPLPAGLEAALRDDRRVATLVAVALGALADPDVNSPSDRGFVGVTRIVAAQFLFGRGWRYLAAQCRTLLVGREDAIRFPLPAPLHFVYPILRLPLWLWRRGVWATSSYLSFRRP